MAFRQVWVRSGPGLNGVSWWRISVPVLLSIRLRVSTRWFEWQRQIRLWAASLRMSHLTAAETLDLGKVTSPSKVWTISLSGDERHSWRSRAFPAFGSPDEQSAASHTPFF